MNEWMRGIKKVPISNNREYHKQTGSILYVSPGS